MSFKRFLIRSSGSPPVLWSRTVYEVLKEGTMENTQVKLYEIRTSGLKMLYKEKAYRRTDDGSIIIAHLEPSAQVS